MTKGELNEIVSDLSRECSNMVTEDLGDDEALVSDIAYVLLMLGRSLTQMGADLCRKMPKDFQEDMAAWLKK